MSLYENKKILMADVDDTVAESARSLKPEMAAEISRLIQGGREFAFLSGATVAQLCAQISHLIAPRHHLLGTSGTHYVQVENGRQIECYKHAFSQEEREELLAALEELARHYDIRTLTTREDQIQDRGSQVTFSAIGRQAPLDQKRVFDPDGARRREWVKFLKKKLGEGYSIGIGGTTSIDITRSGIDKGWGIEEFARFHKYQLSQIVFFGDKLDEGGNDFPARRVVDCQAVKNPEDMLARLKQIV